MSGRSAMLKRFLADRKGATAVEYGILISVLSVVIVGGIGVALGAVGDLWADSNGKISTNLK
jgi:pilus assembly protein Flp/PilA